MDSYKVVFRCRGQYMALFVSTIIIVALWGSSDLMSVGVTAAYAVGVLVDLIMYDSYRRTIRALQGDTFPAPDKKDKED